MARPKPNPLVHASGGAQPAAAATPLLAAPGKPAAAPPSAAPPEASAGVGDASSSRAAVACAACGGLSFALLNLCSFFKGVDDSVLPAVFLEVGATLEVGPQALGTLTMVGAFTVGLANPPAGWLGTRYSRPHLIAIGCFVWSVGAVGMGACTTYWMLVVARGINGVGLGMIGPLMFGMVVDSWPAHQRGKALGVLGITGSVGGLVGAWFATTTGSLVVLGFAGWRFPLYTCAIVGVFVGLLVLFFVVDPARSGAEGDKTAAEEPAGWATILAVWAETKECMRIPTFWVIVLQGVFGSTPWAAWGFSTLWLQLICFRSELAANIRACFVSAPQRLAVA